VGLRGSELYIVRVRSVDRFEILEQLESLFKTRRLNSGSESLVEVRPSKTVVGRCSKNPGSVANTWCKNPDEL